MTPQITILIRTSNRPKLFARCWQSIRQQTLQPRIIIGYDNESALSYIPDGIHKVPVTANKGIPFYYDLYCNQLKSYVQQGWIMFLDDDDYFAGTYVLEKIAPYLQEAGAVICQFMRKGRPKPANDLIRAGQIIEGKIGLPCLFLHTNYKNVADLDGYRSGDYRFIKTIAERVPTLFVPIVIVATDRRSMGRMEKNFPKSFRSS